MFGGSAFQIRNSRLSTQAASGGSTGGGEKREFWGGFSGGRHKVLGLEGVKFNQEGLTVRFEFG